MQTELGGAVMEMRTDRKDRRYMSEYTYVDGNTVRKIAVEEEPVRLPSQPKQKVETEEMRRRKTAKLQRIKGMDAFSVLFLTAAIVVTMFVCVKYLEKQADITYMTSEIAKMESKIITMQEENRTAEEEITSAIDLEYIYKVATKKLGMVHPSKEQVITYKSTKSDSVKQYGDIPSGTDNSLRERVLGK